MSFADIQSCSLGGATAQGHQRLFSVKHLFEEKNID